MLLVAVKTDIRDRSQTLVRGGADATKISAKNFQGPPFGPQNFSGPPFFAKENRRQPHRKSYVMAHIKKGDFTDDINFDFIISSVTAFFKALK